MAADVPVSFLSGHTGGHWGKRPAPFLGCHCQMPIGSSCIVGSVGHLVTVSLELSVCGRHVTNRWLWDLVMEESAQPNVPMFNVPNSTGTGLLFPFCKNWQLFSWLETSPPPWGRRRGNTESPGLTLPSLSPITLLGVIYHSGFLGHTIDFDSVGIYAVWVFTWLREINPHLSSWIDARGDDTRLAWSPGATIQCLTHTGPAVSVEQIRRWQLGWLLRPQYTAELWASEVTDSISSVCSGFQFVLANVILEFGSYNKNYRLV